MKVKVILPLIALGTILLDQVSKFWAQKLNLVVLNTGISFSFFPSIHLSFHLFLYLVFLWLCYYFIKCYLSPIATKILLTIFLSAGFSNLLDRIIYGGVRDWLPLLNLKNNLADWLIFVSLLAIIWGQFKQHQDASRNNF